MPLLSHPGASGKPGPGFRTGQRGVKARAWVARAEARERSGRYRNAPVTAPPCRPRQWHGGAVTPAFDFDAGSGTPRPRGMARDGQRRASRDTRDWSARPRRLARALQTAAGPRDRPGSGEAQATETSRGWWWHTGARGAAPRVSGR